MEYLDILKQVLVYILTAYWCYQAVISLCSLIKLKDKPYITNKNHKFMAIIPAHNEEKVIADLIESLKRTFLYLSNNVWKKYDFIFK